MNSEKKFAVQGVIVALESWKRSNRMERKQTLQNKNIARIAETFNTKNNYG